LSWLRNSLLLAASLAGTASAAPDEAVVINAVRHPVDKSYRKMVKGMDLFDEMHAMAPNATLRYRLFPRKRDTRMDAIALHVVADDIDLPVAIAPDHTFTLGRYARALREDAAVRSERKAGSMTWRAEVRTPGLPPEERRLGDLRLECLVGMEAGLVSHYPSLFGRLMDLLEDARDFCNRASVPYLFFADRPLFNVTLTAGERRQSLSVAQLYGGFAVGRAPKEDLPYCDCEVLLDRAYSLPLGDRSWPDDTLVKFDYMDAAAPADDFFAGSTKNEVTTALGAAKSLHFDNGYEVWAYQWGPQERPLAQTEYVVLFDASGHVAKSRSRAAP
jgi:hypothetical protein